MVTRGRALWEEKAAAKRDATYEKIPREWRLNSEDRKKANGQINLTGEFIEQWLTKDDVAITAEDATTLLKKLSNGTYSALQVTQAFCKRTAIAQQINNCLHEIFFDQAFQRAKELDKYLREHGEVVGPLHGLPVSLKDQFHVRGNDTSMGYVGWLDTFEGSTDPAYVRNVDSQIVTELLSLGAVLYCKTSLPQTLLFGETINNLIGYTYNPVNQNLSCGGSSGGEGALSALGGSPLGVGTDIGGSVRIPAAFNGIFSIKPTHDRFSYRNVANVIPGESTYPSSVGFLSSSQDALPLIMRSILSLEPWRRDPDVIRMPWQQEVVDQTLARGERGGLPLKLGVLWNDGVVKPHPPIERGLQMVVDAVRKAGHKVVDWHPPSHAEAKRIHLAFLMADGGRNINAQLDLSGEPLVPPLRRDGNTRRSGNPLLVDEYQNLTLEGRRHEQAYLDYWNSTDADDGQLVDAFIMPNAPHAAVIPGKYYHTGYTEAINLFDYTSTCIPVTYADENKDKADESYQPISDLDAKNWRAYDPKIYHGAPVGLQIVGRKHEEEKTWAIGKLVYQMLKE